MTETKEYLIEYYGVLNPEEIINDDMSYEELFYQNTWNNLWSVFKRN